MRCTHNLNNSSQQDHTLINIMLYLLQPTKSSLLDEDETEDTTLPTDFTPGPNDVVCARGKSYWDHEGNKLYRRLIANTTEKYSAAHDKVEKTLVVSEIVEAIHKRNGKLVKKDKKGGQWVEVDEIFAREKVGQSLRDGLSNKYRSSTKAKRKKRTQVNEKFNGDIDRLIQSNQSVSQIMDELTHEVQKHDTQTSDFSFMTLFSRANSDILETIKKDASMLSQFQDATVATSVIDAI
jgi:hypothetical protein